MGFPGCRTACHVKGCLNPPGGRLSDLGLAAGRAFLRDLRVEAFACGSMSPRRTASCVMTASGGALPFKTALTL
ncbi:MAG: hypothetical protein LBR80_10025 [Deltaproteobacteria bacterium]|jgi:hypothetical protein|nr:hypothetical protein [Deltaproteobacteria bacterium]